MSETKILNVNDLLDVRRDLIINKVIDFEGSLGMTKDQFILKCLDALYSEHADVITLKSLVRQQENMSKVRLGC
jgi:hypothetical protein